MGAKKVLAVNALASPRSEAALRESGRKESDLTRRAPGAVMSAAI